MGFGYYLEIMWNWLKVYFSVAWALKTPFVRLLDKRYKLVSADTARDICEALGITYWEDFSDCDEYAWLFKAEAIRRGLNGAGFVIGRMGGKSHCWNIILSEFGVRQVEPQNGTVFKQLKEYRPWMVIL